MDSDCRRAQALELLGQVPLIDGHNDFAYMVRGWFLNDFNQPGFDLQRMPIGQTDINRLKKGKLGGQIWSAFVPCPKEGESSGSALLATLQQIDLLHRIFERHPDVFRLVTHSSEILPAFSSGKLVSLLSIEGLHQIGGSASVLRMLYRLGVRFATLCHNKGNEYVDSSTAEPVHGGLSARGKEIISEMNRIGMVVDLSHTSHEAQLDVLAQSKAPVIFSHSSCYELCPNPRNVRDEVLHKLKQNGGLIMICFVPSFVTPPPAVVNGTGSAGQQHKPGSNSNTNTNGGGGGGGGGGNRASAATVADHIVHVGQTIGYAHVGVGSDFDGMLEGPPDLDDTSCFPALVEELLRRGVDEGDIRLVLGLNLIRVLREVEDVSRRLGLGLARAQTTPLCDVIPSPWTDEQRALLMARGSLRQAGE